MSNVIPITVHPVARERAKAVEELLADVDSTLREGAKSLAPFKAGITRRINRALKDSGMMLRRARPHLRSVLGEYYLLDGRRNDVQAVDVDLLWLEKQLGLQ